MPAQSCGAVTGRESWRTVRHRERSGCRREEPAPRPGGRSHDVSNDLTVLLGWVAEARVEGLTEDARKYALNIVEQRARMARDLARQAIGGEAVDEPQSIDDSRETSSSL